MKFKKLPIATLVPAAYNPRKDLQADDPEFEKIRRSIQEFGYESKDTEQLESAIGKFMLLIM
jgi:hypothetical protein